MERIHATPTICSAKPVIKGTRIMVRNILGMLRAGDSVEDVLAAYPGIVREDVEAAVDFAIELEEPHVIPNPRPLPL